MRDTFHGLREIQSGNLLEFALIINFTHTHTYISSLSHPLYLVLPSLFLFPSISSLLLLLSSPTNFQSLFTNVNRIGSSLSHFSAHFRLFRVILSLSLFLLFYFIVYFVPLMAGLTIILLSERLFRYANF